jgi:hypothetical protein
MKNEMTTKGNGTRRFPATLAWWLVLPLCLAFPSIGKAAENVITCQTNQNTFIEYGDIVNCSIERIGDTDVIQFHGNMGDTIVAAIRRQGGLGFPIFQLFDPDGTLIVNFTTFTEVKLPKTGKYSLVVFDSGNDQTVDYSLTVERISPPSPTARQIKYNQTVNDNIIATGIDIDPFFFDAQKAGDSITVSISKLSGEGFPIFQLFAPDGTLIVNFTTFTQVKLNQAGQHTILVFDSGNDQAVNYALHLQCFQGTCSTVAIPAISGCIKLKGSPLTNRPVDLLQPGEPTQTTNTDVRGCYKFQNIVAGKSFNVRVRGPVLPLDFDISPLPDLDELDTPPWSEVDENSN